MNYRDRKWGSTEQESKVYTGSEMHLSPLHTGLNFSVKVKNCKTTTKIKMAAKAYGVRLRTVEK